FDEIEPKGAIAPSVSQTAEEQGVLGQEVDQILSEPRAGIVDLTIVGDTEQPGGDQPMINPEGKA
ncbi:hypothetical protein U1Q18_036811, partial [Sarracenia purpurea var. burkii]